MLSLEQYNALLEAIPDINTELRSKGHEVPAVSANAPTSTPSQPAKSPSKERRKKKKMNIEATSDEESD